MTKPKIQILSDLHLESPKAYDLYRPAPSAPYLALLGDIGCLTDTGYLTFLADLLPHFKNVFLLLGNHEPYHHSNWEASKEKLRRFEKDNSSKFVFLDQTRHDLSDTVTILGCTLFSNVPPEKMERVSLGLNDFYQINDWTVEQHNAAHASDLAWLNQQVASIAEKEPNRKIVILTHHSPTIDARAVDPAHKESKRSDISSGFMSDLRGEECWKNASVKVWAFGHTHFNCDFEVGGKRVTTNQKGYYSRQSPGFEEGKCIEI